jgi:2-oxoisovalerate dehydrogenase E1 component alpha subunit
MTVLDQPVWHPRTDPAPLMPDAEPYRVLGTPAAHELDARLLTGLYGRLVRGRRYNRQATALTMQGRLAVYPSSTGQEACQIAVALALHPQDWLFPSYRDTLAVISRGVDPVHALSLLRGDWHTGYDPREHRVAPLSTPLATQLPHAVGLARAARLAGDDVVALAMVGDGGTSEGDFHEALNFAAVWRAPVVFFVQNNGFAISVPLEKQTAAPSLAHKAVGYGMAGRLVDGNDVLAVREVLDEAVGRARAGGGPTLVEALTYRIDAHTNADDATRYRDQAEVEEWRRHDPVTLLERELRRRGLLDDATVRDAAQAAERAAADLREGMNQAPALDPMDLFAHVYAEPTPVLREQAAMLTAELEAEAEAEAEADAAKAVAERGPVVEAVAERGPEADVAVDAADAVEAVAERGPERQVHEQGESRDERR